MRAERPRWRTTLMYRLDPRVQVGVEGNIAAEEVGPLLNWIASPETEKTPLVTFGTSSDRIFSPKGQQAYYLTVAKGLHGTRLAPYVGVSWSTWEDRMLFPVGVSNFVASGVGRATDVRRAQLPLPVDVQARSDQRVARAGQDEAHRFQRRIRLVGLAARRRLVVNSISTT